MHIETWKLDLLLFVLQYWWALGLGAIAAVVGTVYWLIKRKK